MSFLLIKGTFHLVDRNAAGKETGFQPDGDSMQFKPDDPGLLGQLTVLAQPVRLTLIGSTPVVCSCTVQKARIKSVLAGSEMPATLTSDAPVPLLLVSV